ncbi:hypothetical protein IFM89_032134 [Coptis chinensis]|uniref:Uncharacterized protein n=1 Tax=Coptis chinensis TaxID=261450 RepID=A0A835MD08_9MAGN|nr:hypothetical protein IFM89_032134 [Coptis chinensis]
MSKNLTGVGGSLPVENVQVLAGKELKSLPNRYVRPELEHDDDVIPTDNSLEIPVIDLSGLLDQQYACDELAKFYSNCLDGASSGVCAPKPTILEYLFVSFVIGDPEIIITENSNPSEIFIGNVNYPITILDR